MSKSMTYVCFPCQKHRSLHYDSREEVCPECGLLMTNIGAKLQVPKKSHAKEWDELWRQWISPGYETIGPGYGSCGVPEIDEENRHFVKCKAKKKAVPGGSAESTGCKKCDAVWKRLPESEKESWRRGRWGREWSGARS